MLPKQIQDLASKADPNQRKKIRWNLFWIYLATLGFGLTVTAFLPIKGVFPLFWAGYWNMFLVNLGDLIGLDWLFRQNHLTRLMIPGTENCPAWQTKNWMLSLGLPEHLILWPLLVCPVVGLIYSLLVFI